MVEGPIDDILRVEVRGLSLGRTILAGVGVYATVIVAVVVLWALENDPGY